MTDQLGGFFLFARNYLKHPTMLGWPFPSSRFLINGLLKWVDWQRAGVIVEYGPGTGSFTAEILRRMRPEATLIAMETNEEFVRFLRKTLKDERLHLIHDSATQIQHRLEKIGCGKADYVITGIPFRTIQEQVRQGIMQATSSVLNPDGACLMYSFSSRVRPYLEKNFGQVHQEFELMNFLPAKLWRCTRPNGHA
jgi:phospholipid N-methyltransferase